VLNLCAKLLRAPQMPGKVFVDGQICHFLYQPPCCACCIQVILAEDPPVSDTEILHQLFLGIMRY
jgi:hypothetical protein